MMQSSIDISVGTALFAMFIKRGEVLPTNTLCMLTLSMRIHHATGIRVKGGDCKCG